MDIISEDVRRLDRLISDISDASRLDAELTREDAAPVDIEDMLNTIIPLFTQSIRGRAPKIILDIPKRNSRRRNRYMVLGHDNRLGQVIVNLLQNAVSFSPKRGTVRVSARRIGGEVEIVVEDEGRGIAPGDLKRVFDRFYTDRPGEDAFGKNSGLGLNISQQIIIAHGGEIWAENGNGQIDKHGRTSRNRGARFVIRLPAINTKRG